MADFAKIRAGARRPVPDFVIARGRYLVGALTLGGAFFILGHADPASAAPRSSTTPKAAVKPAGQVYTIAAGDHLTSIAQRFGVSIAALVNVNHIADPNRITAGQTLVIPAGGAAAPAAPAPRAVAKATAAVTAVSAGPPSPGQSLPGPVAGSPRAAYNATFNTVAKNYGINAELLKALAYQESGWNNDKVSSVGAIGIGQLMPDTVTFVNENLVAKALNPRVPAENIQLSAAYLRYLLKQTGGNETLTLASYYQGLGAVQRIGLYDDTKVYIANVQALRARWF